MKRDLSDLVTTVTEVDPAWPRVSVGDSPRLAAKVLADSGAHAALVYDGDVRLGCVTSHALLRILADDHDPLTGLPRADRLRDWMAEKLAAGQEVALIFLDLDGFKGINAERGHTAGDEALRRVAAALESVAEPDTDFCARYGGDEFVIATLRHRGDAEALAGRVRAALAISASVGFSGGRRQGRRPESNVGSTVEELIRLASLDCMSKKSR